MLIERLDAQIRKIRQANRSRAQSGQSPADNEAGDAISALQDAIAAVEIRSERDAYIVANLLLSRLDEQFDENSVEMLLAGHLFSYLDDHIEAAAGGCSKVTPAKVADVAEQP